MDHDLEVLYQLGLNVGNTIKCGFDLVELFDDGINGINVLGSLEN